MKFKVDIKAVYDELDIEEIIKFKEKVDSLSLTLGNLQKKFPYFKKNKKDLDSFIKDIAEIELLAGDIEWYDRYYLGEVRDEYYTQTHQQERYKEQMEEQRVIDKEKKINEEAYIKYNKGYKMTNKEDLKKENEQLKKENEENKKVIRDWVAPILEKKGEKVEIC